MPHEVTTLTVVATWNHSEQHYEHDYEPHPEGGWKLPPAGGGRFRTVGGARRSLNAQIREGGFDPEAKFLIRVTEFRGRPGGDESHVSIHVYDRPLHERS